MTPMPAVKPTMTGAGMNLMTAPRRARPISTRIAPAMNVATCKPAMPYFAVTPDRMAMKAPVGPATCTRVPPNSETARPPRMAVYSPCSGRAPDAIAKAIASGSATTPTMSPESRLRSQCSGLSRPARKASQLRDARFKAFSARFSFRVLAGFFLSSFFSLETFAHSTTPHADRLMGEMTVMTWKILSVPHPSGASLKVQKSPAYLGSVT